MYVRQNYFLDFYFVEIKLPKYGEYTDYRIYKTMTSCGILFKIAVYVKFFKLVHWLCECVG